LVFRLVFHPDLGDSDSFSQKTSEDAMERTPAQSRSLGRGYRARIRELHALGMSEAQILDTMPGLRRSELRVTLSLSQRRGRPPKNPTILSMEAVRRWRATQRPRTLRAALECIDFLLERVTELEQQRPVAEVQKRHPSLLGFR
jgi:hypothetical protein